MEGTVHPAWFSIDFIYLLAHPLLLLECFMCFNNLSPTFSAQNEALALFGESLISLPLVNLVSQQDAFGGDDLNGA